MMNEVGLDYAYARLVKTAREQGYEQTLQVAREFYPVVLECCAGTAYFDIDLAREHHVSAKAYKIVVRVCNELRGK